MAARSALWQLRRMGTTVGFQSLRAFRVDLYGCFRRRADALFELANVLLGVQPCPHCRT